MKKSFWLMVALFLALLTATALAASPDINITHIDGNADNNGLFALPPYSYFQDGNLTITFTVSDLDAPADDLNFNMWYSTTAGGYGNVIVQDLNLNDVYCDANSAWNTTIQCRYDFNIHSAIVASDGNYFIDVVLNDSTTTDTNSSTTFMVDNTAPFTYTVDFNWNTWQGSDANVNFTCLDTNSGCQLMSYRVDTDDSNTVSYGAWQHLTTSDFNVLITADGNWAVDFNSTDDVNNIEDTNTIYVLISRPDVNVALIDGNLASGALPPLSHTKDGNVTIDFNVAIEDINGCGGDLSASLYYSSIAGSFSNLIIADLNLMAVSTVGDPYSAVHCDDLLFSPKNDVNHAVTCHWDFNIIAANVLSDGNYFIDINLSRAVDINATASSATFMIDNNKPFTVAIDFNYTWKAADQNVSLNCVDTNSGCGVTYYRIDTDDSNTASYGPWFAWVDGNGIVFNADGNWALDINSIDNAHNQEDTNTLYVLRAASTTPSTTADNNSGWQTTDANVALTCTSAVGCASTKFKLDIDATSTVTFGDWNTYDANIFINTDGNFTIDYNSTDSIGNIEATHRAYVLVDKTGPTLSITSPADGASVNAGGTITYSGSDATSGLVGYSVKQDTGPWSGNGLLTTFTYNFATSGSHIIYVLATDIAGNTTQAQVNVTVLAGGGGSSGGSSVGTTSSGVSRSSTTTTPTTTTSVVAEQQVIEPPTTEEISSIMDSLGATPEETQAAVDATSLVGATTEISVTETTNSSGTVVSSETTITIDITNISEGAIDDGRLLVPIPESAGLAADDISSGMPFSVASDNPLVLEFSIGEMAEGQETSITLTVPKAIGNEAIMGWAQAFMRTALSKKAVGCTAYGECNDKNPCTRDLCKDGLCRNISVSDGVPCGTGMVCQGAKCIVKPVEDEIVRAETPPLPVMEILLVVIVLAVLGGALYFLQQKGIIKLPKL